MIQLTPHLRQKIIEINFIYLRKYFGFILYFFSILLFLVNKEAAGTKALLTSIRYSYYGRSTKKLKSLLEKDSHILNELLCKDVSEGEALVRSIVLSFPSFDDGKIVKGVMVITFTRTSTYFLNQDWFARLDQLFVFVLEPSWAGYADPEILAFLSRSSQCLVEATEIKDRVFLNTLYPNNIALSFGASNWIDPNKFKPTDATKIYDSIYVANLNPVKRIYRYVDAVKNIVMNYDKSFKACLVCVSWGGQKGFIEKYIDQTGMSNNIVLFGGLEQRVLIEKLNESKVNILLTYKEGSNRALFESLFVNIPVICLSENIGVNKSYINEFTGLLIPDSYLEEALVEMKSNWNKYSPRNWAIQNITPLTTTAMLSQVLQSKYQSDCNYKLYVKANSPEVVYTEHAVAPREINKSIFDCIAKSDSIKDIVQELNHIETLNFSPKQ